MAVSEFHLHVQTVPSKNSIYSYHHSHPQSHSILFSEMYPLAIALLSPRRHRVLHSETFQAMHCKINSIHPTPPLHADEHWKTLIFDSVHNPNAQSNALHVPFDAANYCA